MSDCDGEACSTGELSRLIAEAVCIEHVSDKVAELAQDLFPAAKLLRYSPKGHHQAAAPNLTNAVLSTEKLDPLVTSTLYLPGLQCVLVHWWGSPGRGIQLAAARDPQAEPAGDTALSSCTGLRDQQLAAHAVPAARPQEPPRVVPVIRCVLICCELCTVTVQGGARTPAIFLVTQPARGPTLPCQATAATELALM